MQCPKCGYEQPDSPTCERCGIVIAKFLERQLLAANPVEAVKLAVKRLSAGLSGPWISFAPDIPSDDLWAALASYPVEEQAGRGGEEVLALIREQDFDSVPGNHTLITTRRIIRFERSLGAIHQLELAGLRSVAITGLRFEKLKLNDRELPVWALTQLKEPERQALLRVFMGIVREFRAAGPGMRMRSTRLTDYPSYMSVPGDGRVHGDQVAVLAGAFAPPPLPADDPPPAPAPALVPQRQIEFDDGDGEEDRPPELWDGNAAAPTVAPPLVDDPGEMEIVTDPNRHESPLLAADPAMVSPTSNDQPVFYQWQNDENPPPPAPVPPQDFMPAGAVSSPEVSAGGSLLANIVGFFVGGFVGIPLGSLIGGLLHLPGKGPYYLGLVIGVMIWTGVANGIKSRFGNR